ncbi:MAG: hypothetical protein OEY82_10925 [Gammaproteobacteria bacterium]|nr:hypothetical protein [Gammaproteobacteria bacterium]MDH5584364.1 hypothetical protein [Gammaproteobacteria bacterium]
MKILTTLVLVQTGILSLLFVKIVNIEEKVSVVEQVAQSRPVSDIFSAPLTDRYSRDSHANSNELQLRNIIREELAAHLIVMTGSDNQDDSTIAVESTYTAENQDQLNLVAQKLDYFESVGSISEMEMQNIQTDIAKLHKADQGRMLNRLMRTMNAGDIKGRL